MRCKSGLALACAAALSVGACADITKLETFITSPLNQQTLAVLSAGAKVFICDVSAAFQLAGAVAPAFSPKAGATTTINEGVTVSGAVCTALNGTPVATTTAVAGQAVAVSPTAVATVQ